MGGAYDAAARVANGRDGERNIDQAAVLDATDGFEGVYRLRLCDSLEDLSFLGGAILGQQERHGLANGFGRGIAVYVFSAGVPTEYGALKGFAYDGVFGRLYDGRQMG